MKMFILSALLCAVTWQIPVLALYKGDFCTVCSRKGQCTLLEECEFAQKQLMEKEQPIVCGFESTLPLVCCPTPNSPTSNSPLSNGPPPNYSTPNSAISSNPFSIPLNRNLSISAFKCEDYNRPSTLLAFGTLTKPREFPHMALLGYGTTNNINWLCGGSLISEDFALTAAHCVNSKQFGKVQFVRLGELDYKSKNDDAKPEDYTIVEIFSHPKYKAPSHYHDIALLQLNRKATLNNHVKPACIYSKLDVPTRLIVTGWGKKSFTDDLSSHLLKIEIDKVTHSECAQVYSNANKNKLANGILDDIQICAGDPNGKDACPGDSGGPIQFYEPGNLNIFFSDHYTIVGITSFGKACGIDRTVGVYTRVAPYVPWIEKIVWK